MQTAVRITRGPIIVTAAVLRHPAAITPGGRRRRRPAISLVGTSTGASIAAASEAAWPREGWQRICTITKERFTVSVHVLNRTTHINIVRCLPNPAFHEEQL